MRFFRRFFCASTSASFTSALSSVCCCCLLDFFAKTDSSGTLSGKPLDLSEFRPSLCAGIPRSGSLEAGLQFCVLRLLGGGCSPRHHALQQGVLAPAHARLAKPLDDAVHLGALVEVRTLGLLEQRLLEGMG